MSLFCYESKKKIAWFIIISVGLFGIAASVGSVRPENIVEEVASNESSELFISSVAAVEVKKIETPKELVSHYSAKYGVSAKVISNVIHCESSWNPKIYGDGGRAF